MNESNIKKTPEQLVVALELVLSAGDDLQQALGLTAPELTAAQAAHDATADAISAKAAALAQVTATSQAKLAAKARAVASMNAMQKTALASTATNGQLAAVGFPLRRSGTPRPATPQQVTGLAATPATDGTVRLAWDRAGNPRTAVFTVEASADGAAWAIVAATSRVSLVLDGYAPGATAYFRVTASVATAASRPSDAAGIYAPALPSRPALRVA